MPTAAETARVQRLLEAWRVLSTLRADACRWGREREIAALGTAMAIVDACVSIEEGHFAERDKFGQLVANPDLAHVARLREIAAIRDVFASERTADVDEAEATG